MVAVAAVAWTGCDQKEVPEEALARPVKLATVSAEAPAKVYSASGVIRAAKRVELAFERAAVLAEMPVAQGQEVQAGEVLAKLDVGQLEILARARQARLEEARIHYERIQRLFDKDAVAQADLDRAKAAHEVAQSEWEQVQRDLEQSVLRAPFSGRVAATLADRFQNVQPKQPILVLHDISSYEVRIDLPETFILEVGETTQVVMKATFDKLPGLEFPVQLKEFSTEANPQTLTYAIVFAMAAPEGQPILPGMSATIHIAIQGDAVDGGQGWVPAGAVFSEDGQTSAVWLLDGATMRVRRAAVQTGVLRGDQVQILAGLEPGDVVAASGIHSLYEGEPVRPYDSRAH